jgi:hypothetical protein
MNPTESDPPSPDQRSFKTVDADLINQASRFLEFLFHSIPCGFVEFNYLHSCSSRKMVGHPVFFPLPLDCQVAAQQILNSHDKYVIVIGPAPRFTIPRGGKPGKDYHVTQVGCVWVDLIYTQANGGAIEVNRRIKDFPLRPSVVVNSVHGRQIYYALTPPAADGELVNWDELMHGLREVLGVNNAVNPSCLLFLPGSPYLDQMNSPRNCCLDENDSSWVRYSLKELEQAISEMRELRSVEVFDKMHITDGMGISFRLLKNRGVSFDVIETIVTGHSTSRRNFRQLYDSDDHSRDIWISTNLLNKGFNQEQIKNIFRAHPNGCGSKWSHEQNGEQYLELVVRTAIGLRRNRLDEEGSMESIGENSLFLELPSGYSLEVDGSLWFKSPKSDETHKTSKPIMVASSYIGIAQIREDIYTGQISLTIAFKYSGRLRKTTITRAQMVDARQLVASLSGEGAPITSNNARAVISYLTAYEHEFNSIITHRRVTSRFGRCQNGETFHLPGIETGVEFAPVSSGDASLYRAYSSRCGSLSKWRDIMREIAEESLMIPQVAVLASFVPPIQSKLQIPNFILDLFGDSSTGKSTSLKLAASVFGNPIDHDSLIMQWMNTKVAIENVASMCSELPIFLDDAQHCPNDLKRSVIYMIANGRGKGRAARGGGIREVSTWHTVAMSTSEEPLFESSPHEGARGRILPVGGSVPPFPVSSSSTVQMLVRGVTANHGHAGEAYIRHLNGWDASEWDKWRRRYNLIRNTFMKNSTSNLIDRLSEYIAAIQVAAEVACPLLGLQFKPDVVGSWLMLHVGVVESNQNTVSLALRALADHYVKNIKHFAGDGQYNSEKKVVLLGSSREYQYVGFLRSTIDSVFRTQRWKTTTILNKLADAGMLCATEDDRYTKKVSIEGVKHRMVCIKWGDLFPDDSISDIN